MAPTIAPAQRLGHVPALDGLRGVAVLMVVVSHLNLLVPGPDITDIAIVDDLIEGGYLGVDVFFVLSGFLITVLLLQEERGSGVVRFGAFYARRALRLLPALYLLLLTHATYTLLTDLPWEPEGDSVLAAVLYWSNWQVVNDPGSVANGTNHLWSLAIEEQFYLVWPVLLTALIGLRRSARTVTLVLVAAIAAVVVHRAMLWDDGVGWVELLVRTDTRADALLVGALVGSLWIRGAVPKRGISAAAWVGFVVAVVYTATVKADSSTAHRGGATVFAVAVALVVLAMVQRRWGSSLLGHPAIRSVGLVSYGLYLWHFPVFVVVARYGGDLSDPLRALVGVMIAAACTLTSWFLLEQPLQQIRRRYRPQQNQPAAAGAA